MTHKMVIIAFTFVFAGALLVSVIQKYFSKNQSTDTAEGFLLADKNLGKLSILNLFLSSSFGVAAFFYAVSIGYNIGFWGFILQATWSVGFLFLLPFTTKIKSANSLHDFLGKQFEKKTKLFSAICYFISLVFLMAWEARIVQKQMTFLVQTSDTTANTSIIFALVLVLMVVIFYTLVGGLKGNATVDKFLNLIKISFIVVLTLLLALNFASFSPIKFVEAMFPTFASISANFGIWAITTNIFLNLFSQFTESGAWQNVIVSKVQQNTQWTLKASSIIIFLTIGFFGNLIGVLLVGASNLNPDLILTAPLNALQNQYSFLGVGILILIITCMMSLLNTLLLVSTRVFAIDILQINKGNNLVRDEKQKLNNLKIWMIIISVFSIGGINYIINLTRLNLFELIYIFMVCPFSYFGPVMIGLATKRSSDNMWIVIVLSATIGLISVVFGTITKNKFLLDGAASFTLIISFTIAYFLSKKDLKMND